MEGYSSNKHKIIIIVFIVESNMENWQLVRRFFLVDRISGITQGKLQLSLLQVILVDSEIVINNKATLYISFEI